MTEIIISPQTNKLLEKIKQSLENSGIKPPAYLNMDSIMGLNYQLMSSLLTPEQFHQYWNHTLSPLPERPSIEKLRKIELATELMHKGIGMLLIRPPMIETIPEVLKFLKTNGLIPLFQKGIQLDPQKEYWQLYSEAITHPGAFLTIPTRTLVYTSGESTVIVFLNTRPNEEILTPDEICQEYKGVQGLESTTLRGEIVYKEAKKQGYHNPKLPNMKIVDPLGVYRFLVQQYPESGPHAHLPEENKLLQYTGVGIHVPDTREFPRDLATLLDPDEIQTILLQLSCI